MTDIDRARALARELLDVLGEAPGDGSGGFSVSTEKSFDLSQLVNLKAEAIGAGDYVTAADKLGVTVRHIEALRKVESGPAGSFDSKGRPTILYEPHVFSRLTNRKYDATHPAISYPTWGKQPYPKTADERWRQMAQAGALDMDAALQSASWGLFQIMGFHWQALGYASPQAFALAMKAGEPAHLYALVQFIKVNGLDDELRACRAGAPDSCRAFAAGYNGRSYETGRYHTKLAEALK